VLVHGMIQRERQKRRKTVKSIQKIMLNIPSSVACHVSVSSNVFTALRVKFYQNFSVLILKWNKTKNIIEQKEREKEREKQELFILCLLYKERNKVLRNKHAKKKRKLVENTTKKKESSSN
jgi:hypothetical protein